MIVVGLAAVALLIAVVALFRTTPTDPAAHRRMPPGDSGKGLVDVAGPLGFAVFLFRRRKPPEDPDPDAES